MATDVLIHWKVVFYVLFDKSKEGCVKSTLGTLTHPLIDRLLLALWSKRAD